MKKEITYGGFFVSNIRRWLLKECLETSDPTSFLLSIQEISDEMVEDMWEDSDIFWANAQVEISD